MFPYHSNFGLASILLLLYLSLLLVRQRIRRRGLPPGPPGWPIIGNFFDMPKDRKPWLTFASWRKWGDISSIDLLGKPYIIINSATVLEKFTAKGASFSSRPDASMAGKLSGFHKSIVLSPYAERWRAYRKLLAHTIGTPILIEQYYSLEEEECLKFLKRILNKQDTLPNNVRQYISGVVFRIVYGIELKDTNDPFLKSFEEGVNTLSEAFQPGRWLVDTIPILKYIPERLMPKGGFKAAARGYGKVCARVVNTPLEYAKNELLAGRAPVSYVSSILDTDNIVSEEKYDLIKFSASSLCLAGSDPSIAPLTAFFLAMIQYPEVQRKAQAEIDSVIGTDRLPTLKDREGLPYIRAIVTEAIRWHSAAPIAAPHVSVKEEIIDGYVIPKGSVVIGNLWNMLCDPELYPNPEIFDPERHIPSGADKSVQYDPRLIAFGWARRICPGMHLADTTLFCLIAAFLSVFNITHKGTVPPKHEYSPGMVSFPMPFEYDIYPRDESKIVLLENEYTNRVHDHS